jgi:hypothetical protein
MYSRTIPSQRGSVGTYVFKSPRLRRKKSGHLNRLKKTVKYESGHLSRLKKTVKYGLEDESRSSTVGAAGCTVSVTNKEPNTWRKEECEGNQVAAVTAIFVRSVD